MSHFSDVLTELQIHTAALLLQEQRIRNKYITDPDSGVQTIYADDSSTPLLTGDLWQDVNATTAYSGDGSERRDALT